MKTIIQDEREIAYIRTTSGNTFSYTDYKIIPYHENGEMAPVIWFAIVDEDGNTEFRINGKYVEILRYVY